MSAYTTLNLASQQANKRRQEYLVYGLLCLPAIIHLVMVYKYALNIPVQDDYDSTLLIFNKISQVPFLQKISLLFEQQNEHRTLLSRLIVGMHYLIFGEINFRHVILFNALMAVGIFAILTGFLKRSFPGFWQFPAMIVS